MDNKDNNKIEELLTRGVTEVIDFDNLKKELKSGKKLRIKLGIDPTSPNIHIGRAIPLLKLREFQELGHKVVFIIGDFTGVIGDTSDKESERPMLSKESIGNNLKSYIDQAAKIIDIKKCEIKYNSEWLGKLNYHEIGEQADLFSLNEFLSRENIKKRFDAGKRVSLREFLYPMMQGYDSVAVEADVEIGGNDQRFNLLAGRTLQKKYKQKSQNILMTSLIDGLDGRKMSSSWGNTINVLDTPEDMYGKIMSLRDELIIQYFTLTTRVDLDLVQKYKKDMVNGSNPRDYKMKLAFELVKMYYSEDEANTAQDNFINKFKKNIVSKENMSQIKPDKYNIKDVLIQSGFCASNSEVRRLIEQGGVKVNNIVIEDFEQGLQAGDVIQKGKRFYLKVS